MLYISIQKLNSCLSYVIHKFSDYFQALPENEIRCHAEKLEKEVERRTGELAASEAKYRMLVEETNYGYDDLDKIEITYPEITTPIEVGKDLQIVDIIVPLNSVKYSFS